VSVSERVRVSVCELMCVSQCVCVSQSVRVSERVRVILSVCVFQSTTAVCAVFQNYAKNVVSY